MELIKQCDCGSRNFTMVNTVRVDYNLDETGTLTAIDEEDMGNSGFPICNNCGREYTLSNFLQIITK